MSYLNDTIPADTEAVKQGANRIRELKTQLNALISQIFNDAGEFLTKWITQAMLGDKIVGTGQIADGAIGATQIADGSITLTELADGTPRNILAFSNDGSPTTIDPGTAGQILTSNGTVSKPTFQSFVQPHGIPNFIPNVQVISGVPAENNWATIQHLETHSIPATASAVLMVVYMHASGISSPPRADLTLRASASSNQFVAMSCYSSTSHDSGFSSFIIVPVVNIGGNLTFDWKVVAVAGVADMTGTVVGFIS
jgi:hypothetical protein